MLTIYKSNEFFTEFTDYLCIELQTEVTIIEMVAILFLKLISILHW